MWKYRIGPWSPWRYTRDQSVADRREVQGYEVVWAPFAGDPA